MHQEHIKQVGKLRRIEIQVILKLSEVSGEIACGVGDLSVLNQEFGIV